MHEETEGTEATRFTVRPMAAHEDVTDLPEAISQVLVCEYEGEIVCFLYSTVYGWTHSGEVNTPNSTPETWAHWQSYKAVLKQFVIIDAAMAIDETKAEGPNCRLSEKPDRLNYQLLLAWYIDYVEKRTGNSFLEHKNATFFGANEWRALKVAEQQPHSRL